MILELYDDCSNRRVLAGIKTKEKTIIRTRQVTKKYSAFDV